jgi:hypothetical protein
VGSEGVLPKANRSSYIKTVTLSWEPTHHLFGRQKSDYYMFFTKIFTPLALVIASASVVQGGPIAYGLCQTGALTP